MRPDDGSITHWIHEIKHGNRDAAQGLWERYFARLVLLARDQLKNSNRRVADEEDVALSAFDTFCRTAEEGKFPDLTDRDGLWRLLIRITANKAIDQQRKQGRRRRGSGKIRGESVFRNSKSGEDFDGLAQAIGTEPTPEFVAIMGEQVKWLLDALDDDELKEIAVAKLEGYSNQEIADRLNRSLTTIERRLKLIRAKLSRETPD